jgi:hypothetical protein
MTVFCCDNDLKLALTIMLVTAYYFFNFWSFIMFMKKLALILPLLAASAVVSVAHADDYTIVLDATAGINAAYPTGNAYGADGVDGLSIYDNTTSSLVTASSAFSFNDFLKTYANGSTFDFKVEYIGSGYLDLGYTAGAKSITYGAGQGIAIDGSHVAFDLTPSGAVGSYLINDAKATWSAGLHTIDVTGILGPKGSQQTTLSITVTPVPEPEQWAMLLLGLPLIGRFVNRKKAA